MKFTKGVHSRVKSKLATFKRLLEHQKQLKPKRPFLRCIAITVKSLDHLVGLVILLDVKYGAAVLCTEPLRWCSRCLRLNLI